MPDEADGVPTFRGFSYDPPAPDDAAGGRITFTVENLWIENCTFMGRVGITFADPPDVVIEGNTFLPRPS